MTVTSNHIAIQSTKISKKKLVSDPESNLQTSKKQLLAKTLTCLAISAV